MVSLNDKALCHTTLAALAIVAGVVLGNTSKTDEMKMVGAAFFVGGWLYMAWSLAGRVRGQGAKLALWLGSLGVVAGVMMHKNHMPMGPMLFMAAWVLLGLTLSFAHRNKYRWMGVVAAGLVLWSMTNVIPEQRKKGVVDGPGYPMFMLAWGLIIFLNSVN
jgi:hypothetical protein